MIREQGHISAREGIVLVFVTLSAKLFLQYPAFLIEVSGPAAWQSALIMTAGGILCFLPVVWVSRRFPETTLAELSAQVGGPILGLLVPLIVGLWLIAAVTITVRNFAETFIIAMLPNTPPSALIIVAMACVLYASFRGAEPLSRTAVVLIPIIFAGSILVLLMSLPRADPSRLYPFWGHGLVKTISGGLWFSSMAAECILLLALGSAFRRPKDLQKSGTMGILMFGLVTTATVAILVSVFGAPDAAQQPFPMYNLARMIYLGRFAQRMESLLVLFWVFAAAVRLSALFHAGAVSLSGAFRLPYYRPLLFPLAVLVSTLALLPEDFLIVLRLDRDYMRPAGLFILMLPLVLLVLALIRRKGVTTHAQ